MTIVPRGQALGVTYQRPEDDRYNYPEGYLRARITGALGGRVAEEIVYGTRTQGRKRHRASYRPCEENGHPLGNEREAGTVELAPRENPYLGGPGGYSASNISARRPPASWTPKYTGS